MFKVSDLDCNFIIAQVIYKGWLNYYSKILTSEKLQVNKIQGTNKVINSTDKFPISYLLFL